MCGKVGAVGEEREDLSCRPASLGCPLASVDLGHLLASREHRDSRIVESASVGA